ncbi:MAG: cell division protein SepF [Acholeplasmatales bacterium]|nr:cell division protein SepF [Acholeplasmatales bacterium]
MALFKKKNDSYSEASSALNQSQTAADRLFITKMEDDDELAKSLVEKLKEGTPIILNFADMDRVAQNKMLAFMAGAACALEGKSYMINVTTYLFARRVDFLDGSLQDFIQNLPKK